MTFRLSFLLSFLIIAATVGAQGGEPLPVAYLGPKGMEVHIADPDRVVYDAAEATWRVKASPIGLGSVPEPLLELRLGKEFSHAPENVFALIIKTSVQTHAHLIGQSPLGYREIFTTRTIEPSDEFQVVFWSMDWKVGNPTPLDTMYISLSTDRAEIDSIIDVFQFRPISLSDFEAMTASQLISASDYAPLTIERQTPVDGIGPGTATVLIPRPLAAKNVGNELLVSQNGNLVDSFVITDAENNPRRNLMYTTQLSPDSNSDSAGTVKLELEAEGEKLLLSEQGYSNVTLDQVTQQFEVPHRSIRDYVAFYSEPDLRVIAILSDEFTRPENPAVATASREVSGFTISLETGRFESQLAWRVPAFNHWADAGFRTIASGEVKATRALYVTGANGSHVDRMGLATTAKKSAIRPAIVNPVYDSSPLILGLDELDSRGIRAGALEVYARNFILLHLAQRFSEPPVLMAALTPDMRQYSDAGIVPIDPIPEGDHISLYLRGGVYYLLSDDPGILWTSKDPLRSWEAHEVSLPDEWHGFRLVDLDGIVHLFGLVTEHGRTVLRWMPIDWEGTDPALPVPVVQ